jgi:3-oxoacyl-[acyl-carrier protein] reductase
LEANITDARQVRVALDTLLSATNRLDVLVNNAGVSLIKPFLEITEDEWDHIVDTDLKSVFLCCQAAIPELLKTRGTIVNIASELAISGRAKFAPYTAAKGGIISLTRSLAREFAPTIRVNAVAPGPTSTPMLAAEAAVPGHKESTEDIPLGRYADPIEIATSIVFLASEHAGYFCGDILSPNGGAVMR